MGAALVAGEAGSEEEQPGAWQPWQDLNPRCCETLSK